MVKGLLGTWNGADSGFWSSHRGDQEEATWGHGQQNQKGSLEQDAGKWTRQSWVSALRGRHELMATQVMAGLVNSLLEPERNQLRKEQFRAHDMHGFGINLWQKIVKRHVSSLCFTYTHAALDFWNSQHNLQISWQQHWNTRAFANTQSTRLQCARSSSLLCETTVFRQLGAMTDRTDSDVILEAKS